MENPKTAKNTVKVNRISEQNPSLSYADVLNKFQAYKKVVTLHCAEGLTATILREGFLVNDILK